MRIVVLLVSALFLLACSPPLPPVSLAPAPSALGHLTLYVDDEATLVGDMVDENKSLSTSIPGGVSGALTRAGYQVVTNKSRPHDAEVKLSADVTSVPSIFIIKVDGRVIKDSVARVRLALEADGIRIDEVEATTPGGKPTKPEALDRVAIELVNGLTRSPRLARLADKSRPRGEVVQKDGIKPGSAGYSGDPLVVINVEAPPSATAPKAGGAGAPPTTANNAEKPKSGTAAAVNSSKPKVNPPPSSSPQTTSR